MKSEPSAYSIDHLREEKTTIWDGIRNYQARNFMRSMRIGDKAFFYHSNCQTPGIVGLMEVIRLKVIDPTQFDEKSKYFDPKSKRNNPRWDCTEMSFIEKYNKGITLLEMKSNYDPEDLTILKKGNRLSITPVELEVALNLLNLLK